MPTSVIFIRMASRLNKNDTRPILTASAFAFPAINSPTIAPRSNPNITPNGGKKKIPINIPIMENQIPCLDALNIFAPNKGSR